MVTSLAKRRLSPYSLSKRRTSPLQSTSAPRSGPDKEHNPVSSALSTRTNHAPRDIPTELPANAGRAATGIAIVLMAQLMLVLDVAVMNVALPRIDSDLGFGPASLSWVLNAYTLAFGGLLLLGGRLRDVRGSLVL